MSTIEIYGGAYEHDSGSKHWSCFLLVTDDVNAVVRYYGSNTRKGSQHSIDLYDTRRDAERAREAFTKKKMKHRAYEPSYSIKNVCTDVVQVIDVLGEELPHGSRDLHSAKVVGEIIKLIGGSAFSAMDSVTEQKANAQEAERIRVEQRSSAYDDVEDWGAFS